MPGMPVTSGTTRFSGAPTALHPTQGARAVLCVGRRERGMRGTISHNPSHTPIALRGTQEAGCNP